MWLHASMISSFCFSGITSAPMASTTAVEVRGNEQHETMTHSVCVHLPPIILEYAVEGITASSSCLAMFTLRADTLMTSFFLSSSFCFSSFYLFELLCLLSQSMGLFACALCSVWTYRNCSGVLVVHSVDIHPSTDFHNESWSHKVYNISVVLSLLSG